MIRLKIKSKKKKSNLETSQVLKQLKVLSKRNKTELKKAHVGLLAFKEDLKAGNFASDVWNSDLTSPELGFLFEESYLLRSKMEEKKRKSGKVLNRRLKGLIKKKSWRVFCNVSEMNFAKKANLLKPSGFRKNYFFLQHVQKRLEFKFLQKEKKQKKLFFLKFLQLRQNQGRHLYNLLIDRRLLARILNHEKKVKYRAFCLKKGWKKLPRPTLTQAYQKRIRYFFSRKIQTRRRYKKLRWKFRRNKKKKWRRRGLFRLFRSRYCFRSRFYVPKHFEINYKTGNLFFLGFAHSESTDFRISSIFNIRKLVTFLSS